MSKYGHVANASKELLNVDVEFCKLIKILHEDGYHVLAYDFRGHGRSK